MGLLGPVSKTLLKQQRELRSAANLLHNPTVLRKFVRSGAGVLNTDLSVAARARILGRAMKSNIVSSLEGRSVLSAIGVNAVQGAAIGGLIGGVTEWAQGGNFWDGVGEGAWIGAVGLPAYRMAMRATGATSLLPLGKNGVVGRTSAMIGALSRDLEISRPAAATLRQQQMSNLANAIMSYSPTRKPLKLPASKPVLALPAPKPVLALPPSSLR